MDHLKKMNKKVVIGIVMLALIIIIPIVYYLISPLFIVVEMNEESLVRGISDNFEMGVLLKGVFMPSAHEASGDVIIIDDNGEKS